MFDKKKQPPIKSLIAQGTRIEGNLMFASGMRVDGEIVGDIRSQAGESSILVISETATITGAVCADHVIINGKVVGPVQATELLELQPKASITDDMSYKALEMHQNALIAKLLRPFTGDQVGGEEDKPTLTLATNNG